MSYLAILMIQFSIVAYALVGGVFLAFSDFIMRSLSLTGGNGGVEAMQNINREVFRWVFMVLFLGMAGLSIVIAGYSAAYLSGLTGFLVLCGAVIYFFGCFVVTVFCNVPLNETLANLDPGAPETQHYWINTYLPSWTFWNTLRALACAASAVFLLGGLVRIVAST